MVDGAIDIVVSAATIARSPVSISARRTTIVVQDAHVCNFLLKIDVLSMAN
jgi:hypothetical protein